MTEQQRQQRAAFICEQPYSWLFLAYSTTFFGCAVPGDTLVLAGASPPDGGLRYLLPLVIAWSFWLSLRRWARRIVAALESGKTPQEHPVELGGHRSFAIKNASDTFSDKP
jgi:hypothetical protein